MHVGMNRLRATACLRAVSVPHARGDEPVVASKEEEITKRSPCTWG